VDVNIEFESPKMLGLHGIKKTFNKEIASSETKFQKGSLRSGQKIEYEGSIVILGDVNGGAEVVAGENIVVLGSLRGLAHAGAKGNKQAIIAAGEIESPQIRISNIIKEIEKQEDTQMHNYAYVNEKDEIIIE
ncbi:MAG: septum site-determining protein MinC, partial [Clostridia bacterium]